MSDLVIGSVWALSVCHRHDRIPHHLQGDLVVVGVHHAAEDDLAVLDRELYAGQAGFDPHVGLDDLLEDFLARETRDTLKDGSVETPPLFHFLPDGRVDTVRADARSGGTGPGAVSMPWECRLWNYQKREGVLFPLEGEAAWVTPTGLKPYWRGRITRLTYEFSR